MGKSRVVTVSVTKTPTEVTIGLDKYDGTPGVINVFGALFEAGTTKVLRGKTVQILIGGSLGATVTTGTDGRYRYTFVASTGRYSFQAKFPGDASYAPDWSPLVIGEYGKIGTDLTIDVNPLAGGAPLAITILGILLSDETGGGLPGKTVELWRNNVKIKSMTTKTTSPGQGAYLFHDTLSTQGDHSYYVYFRGDSKYEGCEVSDGATVIDGVPPDEEPPVVEGLGAGVLLLALLVLSQE